VNPSAPQPTSTPAQPEILHLAAPHALVVFICSYLFIDCSRLRRHTRTRNNWRTRAAGHRTSITPCNPPELILCAHCLPSAHPPPPPLCCPRPEPAPAPAPPPSQVVALCPDEPDLGRRARSSRSRLPQSGLSPLFHLSGSSSSSGSPSSSSPITRSHQSPPPRIRRVVDARLPSCFLRCQQEAPARRTSLTITRWARDSRSRLCFSRGPARRFVSLADRPARCQSRHPSSARAGVLARCFAEFSLAAPRRVPDPLPAVSSFAALGQRSVASPRRPLTGDPWPWP